MADSIKEKKQSPWSWISTLYYAQGIPYVVVMTVSVIMYKRLGVSNADIALYTSWLYLPWVIKPLWSPLVDLVKTKRFWIISMQVLIGAGLAGVGLTIPVDDYFKWTLIFFWLLAFSSATHDIAADGMYMLGLNSGDQAYFVGIRSTFYRVAMITGQGVLVIFAGYFESHTGLPPVDIQVKAIQQTTPTTLFVNPDSVRFAEATGELKVISSSPTTEFAVTKIAKAKADSIIALAKTWNVAQGFYKDEKVVAVAKSEGWFSQSISTPLGAFLKEHFGVEKPKETGIVGNVSTIYFRLSAAPEEKVVVALSRESGDKTLTIAEGTRFEFTKENWNKPAVAVVQHEAGLTGSATANIRTLAGNIPLAWMITFFILAGLFIFFSLYHKYRLPKPAEDKAQSGGSASQIFKDFFKVFALFFKKENILISLAFLLLYRFGEAQLVKLVTPFLLDPRELGGLGLTTEQVGLAYGTIGIIMLSLGGIAGGMVASKYGLKKIMWIMAFSIHLPNVAFVYLAYALPTNMWITIAAIGVEQFGYGFGFTAYMLYMLYMSEGEFKTAHYAICTGFMALGMMLPGMMSGWLQEIIGYQHFFLWVVLCTIPAYILIALVPIKGDYGKKIKEA